MARTEYTQEMKAFIAEHVSGRSACAPAELVNARFRTEITPAAMESCKKNYRLKSGVPCGRPKGMPSKRYPPSVAAYITAHYKGVGPTEMAGMLNAEFKTDYTARNIKGYYGNHRLCSGVSGRFKPGQTSHNKGKRGYCPPGCEKGWFKKGGMPHNHKPVGSERVNVDGYIEVKVAEPKKWVAKHRLVWEENHGRIPKGCGVTFLDGNKQNVALDNLALVTNDENLELNRSALRSIDAELTKTGITVAKLKRKIYRITKDRGECHG